MKWSALGIDKNQPWMLIFLLLSATLLEWMVATSSQSYLPAVVHYFGVPWRSTGRYVGITVGVVEVTRGIFSLLGAVVIKKIGAPKYFVIIHICVALTTVSFGFSHNLVSLIASRLSIAVFASAFLCCNVIVRDIVDEKNQPFVVTWALTSPGSIGVILGPSLGGYLSLPSLQYPASLLDTKWMRNFPIFLPNFILASFTLLVSYWGSMCLLKRKKSSAKKQDKEGETVSLNIEKRKEYKSVNVTNAYVHFSTCSKKDKEIQEDTLDEFNCQSLTSLLPSKTVKNDFKISYVKNSTKTTM